MSFLVYYNELIELGIGIRGKGTSWGEQLGDIAESFAAFVGMESHQGAGAESIKSYLAEVHGMIIGSFLEIFMEISARYLLYSDGYHGIDPDMNAVLCEDELVDNLDFFSNSQSEFDETHLRIQRLATDISDILAVQAPAPFPVQNSYQTVGENLYKLKTEVQQHEQLHYSQDFVQLEQMLSALGQFITTFRNMNMGRLYVSGSIQNLAQFQYLEEALDTAAAQRQSMMQAITAAAEREQERLEHMARSSRGILDFIVGGLVVIGGVVAIKFTGGLATPFVVTAFIQFSGGAAVAYGGANMLEALQEVHHGSSGVVSDAVSWNPIRDTAFAWAGDDRQRIYDNTGRVFVAATSAANICALFVRPVAGLATSTSSTPQASVMHQTRTAGQQVQGTTRASTVQSVNHGRQSWFNPDGSINWPPNNGAVPGTQQTVTLQRGQTLGRFGEITPTSRFATQPGASAGQVSLPPHTDPSIYREITVLRPIPGVTQSQVAPWGVSPGGALQFETPVPLEVLRRLGYIAY